MSHSAYWSVRVGQSSFNLINNVDPLLGLASRAFFYIRILFLWFNF